MALIRTGVFTTALMPLALPDERRVERTHIAAG